MLFRLGAVLLMPGGLHTPVQRLFEHPQKLVQPAAQQSFSAHQMLTSFSKAVGELDNAARAAVTNTPADTLEDISRVFDCAVEQTCRQCAMAGVCWYKEYTATFGALNDATPALKQKHYLEHDGFSGFFTTRCVKIKELCGAINEE